jgi:hypothetical protein
MVAAAQKALGDAFANGVKLGLDPEALAHATAQLSGDVVTAKARSTKAEVWARTNADTHSRVEGIWTLAESARRTLDTNDRCCGAASSTFSGVRARITGWETCQTCNSGGLVAVEPTRLRGCGRKGLEQTGCVHDLLPQPSLPPS